MEMSPEKIEDARIWEGLQPQPSASYAYVCQFIKIVCCGFRLRFNYQIKKLLNKLRQKLSTGKTFNQNVRKEFRFVLGVFLTDKNDRSSQPSGQSGCGSGDGRKRRYVGIYHSLRDVDTFAWN